jgi:transposase
MPRIISETERAEIVAQYQAGNTISEISRNLGVTVSFISKLNDLEFSLSFSALPPQIAVILNVIYTLYYKSILTSIHFQRNTVNLWVRRYADEGTVSDHRHNNSGRRSSLFNEQRALLRHIYEETAFFPYKTHC